MCDTNFGGVLEQGNKCVVYSALREICLVVNQSMPGVWELVRDEVDNTKLIGCSDSHLKIGKYEKMIRTQKQDLIAKDGKITVRIRSLDDPAVQALLITEGTYETGMDSSLKMFLSIIGVVISLAFLIYIGYWCCKNGGSDTVKDNTRYGYTGGNRSQWQNYADRQTQDDDDEDEEEEDEQIDSAPHREFYSFKVAATAADDQDSIVTDHIESAVSAREVEMREISQRTDLEAGLHHTS